MKLNWDYYECRNPECKSKFDQYKRFCPNCNSEKSIDYVENGLMRDFLLNLLTTSNLERIKDVALLTASMGLPTQTEIGVRTILQDAIEFVDSIGE